MNTLVTWGFPFEPSVRNEFFPVQADLQSVCREYQHLRCPQGNVTDRGLTNPHSYPYRHLSPSKAVQVAALLLIYTS